MTKKLKDVSYDIQYARRRTGAETYTEADWRLYGCRDNLKQARLLVVATIHPNIVMRVVRVETTKTVHEKYL